MTAPARASAGVVQQFRANTVIVVLPIPDGGIGPNGRDGWRDKARKIAEHREWARLATIEAMHPEGARMWPAARLTIEWRYCGNEPDADGCVARVKPCLDGAQDAGLVLNDARVEIGTVQRTRVAHKPDACVVLTFTRMDEV